MQQDEPDPHADISSRMGRIMQALHAALDACSDPAVHTACIAQTSKAVTAIEELFKGLGAAMPPAWKGRQQVTSMYEAGVGAPGRARMPVEALRVLLLEQPDLLKPLAGSCADGYITAMQEAPAMVLHVPDGRNSDMVQDDADASFLPLVHARMIGATEFKVVDGRGDRPYYGNWALEVNDLTAAYDKAACEHGVCFERIHTFRMEGRSFAHPVMPSLATYMPNLQRVYLATMRPLPDLARFVCALRGLQHLRVLRIIVHAATSMTRWDESDMHIMLPSVERLELGFQLREDVQLPPRLKQLVGGQRCIDGHAFNGLRLRLRPTLAESLCSLTEAHMCLLEMPVTTQPTAQQFRVLQALDASCAVLLVHTGAEPAVVPTAVSTVVTAGYVLLKSSEHVDDVLRRLSIMLPHLTDLWVMNASGDGDVWPAVHDAMRAGMATPARLHPAGSHRRRNEGFEELLKWCYNTGIDVDDDGEWWQYC